MSTISKNELLVTNEKGIVQRLFWMIFFSVLFIRILLILYGILLKIHFVCDRMKVNKIRKANKVMTNQLIYTGKAKEYLYY